MEWRIMDEYELVDLFAGVGGLDLAARSLGVPAVGVELDADACATRRAAGLATAEGDVTAFAPANFPSAKILVGGPPCQTLTIAGQGPGRRALQDVQRFTRRMADREDVTACLAELDDRRTGLVLEPLRWVLAAVDDGRPYESVVLEQVQTTLPVWEEVGNVLIAEGYSVAHGVLNTEEFGVPQTRRRAVLIARRHGTAALPKPTHQRYMKRSSAAAHDLALRPWVTMGEALKRNEPFIVISNYGSAGDPTARGRRTSDEPAAAVTGKFHRNRVFAIDGVEVDRLTRSEAGCLQSFPADYPWEGRDVSQQIGNATPPRLAEHILTSALDLGHSPTQAGTGDMG